MTFLHGTAGCSCTSCCRFCVSPASICQLVSSLSQQQNVILIFFQQKGIGKHSFCLISLHYPKRKAAKAVRVPETSNNTECLKLFGEVRKQFHLYFEYLLRLLKMVPSKIFFSNKDTGQKSIGMIHHFAKDR